MPEPAALARGFPRRPHGGPSRAQIHRRYEIGSGFRGSSALHAVGDSYVLLTHDAGSFPAHVLFAVAETHKGNFSEAIDHYRKALELQPHNGEVLNNIAYLLADKDSKLDEALAYAQQAVEAIPGSPDAAGTLGWILYRKGLYQNAQRQLRRAVAQDRQSTDRNAVIRKYHLAMTYFKTRRQAERR